MQTIKTKYFPSTGTRGAKVKATLAGNSRLKTSVTKSMSDEMTSDWNHAFVAKLLARKMGWDGTMVGGHTKEGMIWVFNSVYRSPRFTI